MTAPIPRARLDRLSRMMAEWKRRQERKRLEGDFREFVVAAWPTVDPTPFEESWAIDALCDHLQAVSDGNVLKLLCNFPPRCGKTKVASVCYPAWTWARQQMGYLAGPQVEFLCGSYNHDLSLSNSNLTRRLILSPWYQSFWGDHFKLRDDQNTKGRFDNTKGGSRIATSVGGSLLGIGGSVILIDDPHNTEGVESDAERNTARDWWSEIRSTRLNDPKQSAIIVIMQRLHEEDVSGAITKGEDAQDWTHLMIPMSYEWNRHCITNIGWNDPRGCDDDGEPLVLVDELGTRMARDEDALKLLEDEREGELMWPERFGPKEVASLITELGSYRASGRLQQSPHPKGGGLILDEWWKLLKDDKKPAVEIVVGFLDTASTEKQENDFTALTTWAVFNDDVGNPNALMTSAWHGRKTFHEMVTKVGKVCVDQKVSLLLVESKANGISASQEIRRLYSRSGFGVQLVDPKGQDKVARVISIQHLFEAGQVWTPDRDWADMVRDECGKFPKGAHDDLVDTVSGALRFLRDSGLLLRKEEAEFERIESMKYRRKSAPLYPA